MLSKQRKQPYLIHIEQLDLLCQRAAALFKRAAANEPLGLREIAQAIEYNQQYVEILKHLEQTAVTYHPEVVIGVKGQTIKFKDVVGFSDWLSENMT